ncbi:MAG: putative manganese-dependent inorganic diphosphatase [Verrucomicrobia bacterium]|nr:putative manganese-dependent inorganic diphosphatase [Verrucomicrobiota bacterium]
MFVIGHRNPDTDSICSAIGYADFKRRTGMTAAVAARCGDTNDRVDFVLKTFGVEPPRFISDVSPKVRDVMASHIVSVLPDTPVAEALAIMDQNNIRVLPVIGADRRCEGLVSVFKMTMYYLPAPNRLFDSRRVLASINGLARTLAARLVHTVNPEREDELILMIGGMAFDSFKTRLEKYPRAKLLVIVGDRRDIQELAIAEKVRLLVVTGGLQPDADVVAAAARNGVSVLLSPHDSATTAMLCRAAITVRHMMHEKQFLTFGPDEPLRKIQPIATESAFLAFPVVNESGEVLGILSKTDFLKKVERQLILVDHNELSQAVQGADEVEIIEIIDHHRIGALTTHQPILFRNEPVGSTSTIVADCFLRYGVQLTKPIAGLLLAGLISDTLNLTSPTTTQRDATILQILQNIAGVDAADFTDKLFSSGSVLVTRPAAQAIGADCKEYTERGHKFSVAQIEEIGFEQFQKRKEQVVAALADFRESKGCYFSALLVSDVATQDSLLLVAGAKEFLAAIDYPEVEPGIYQLKGVVSRKKQLLPYLAHCLQKVK